MKLSRSFLKGFCGSINLSGNKQSKMTNPLKDSEMLRSDWKNIGKDIATGIKKTRSQNTITEE
ncbi:MAG: hypothetical protein MR269_00235 [Clostridiales bacterium]|nr:hypothetical protein [Clostridiales bacterium]